MAHAAVNPNKPRAHSLAYSIMNRLIFRRMSYKTAIFSLFLFETFIGILLVVFFFLNSSNLWVSSTRVANQYRSVLLLIFVVCHIWTLFEMRKCQQYSQIEGER